MAAVGVKAAIANTSTSSEHRTMEPMVPEKLMLIVAQGVKTQ
jgi:hypothetical protein